MSWLAGPVRRIKRILDPRAGRRVWTPGEACATHIAPEGDVTDFDYPHVVAARWAAVRDRQVGGEGHRSHDQRQRLRDHEAGQADHSISVTSERLDIERIAGIPITAHLRMPHISRAP